MFKNIFFDKHAKKVHLWEQYNGKNFYTEENWLPYVWVKSKHTDYYKDIFNKCVTKKTFKSYQKYLEYNEKYGNLSHESGLKPEIQFLVDRYAKINDEDIIPPKLKIYAIDIEVHCDIGYPSVDEAKDKVVLISIKDFLSGKIITFGEKEYTGQSKPYIKCGSEEKIFDNFYLFLQKYPPDLLTGWNCIGFDLPYLINRSNNIFGEKRYQELSPIKIVNIWKSKKDKGRDVYNIDIAGISIIDYMDLYKHMEIFRSKKIERYSLDYVSNYELGEGKLDYGNLNLSELYYKDWNKYVEYNRKDVNLIKKLDNKLGYIDMVQILSLLTKCPMSFYNKQTSLVEGAILTHLRRNNMVAPPFKGGLNEPFEAAYVKEPNKGSHEWVVDLDITSQYPTMVIILNMSLETYVGRILNFTEDEIVNLTLNKNYPDVEIDNFNKTKKISSKIFNNLIKNKKISIAPNGAIFSNSKPGIMVEVERHLFAKRVNFKRKLKEEKKKDSNSDIVKMWNNKQKAIKTILNSLYGATAVPYSRYFNINISKAITSSARKTIKVGEIFLNELLNNPNNDIVEIVGIKPVLDKNIDYCLYCDTDSIFFSVKNFICDKFGSDYWNNLNDEERKNITLKISRVVEKYVNEKSFNEIQKGFFNSIVNDFKISFKQEVIAKSALFIAKKKYGLHIINEEGVDVDKLEIKGLEIVRSDCPEEIRPRLKNIMNDILNGVDDNSLMITIEKYKKELMKLKPEEIASNIGVNNINKYIVNGSTIKGTPWHIKGVHAYNVLLKELHIEDRYEPIFDSQKVKVVYVKYPKPYKYDFEAISFIRWPKEFYKIVNIDYEKQINKYFLNKIEMLLKPMNKEHLLFTKGKLVGTFF